MMYPPYMMDPNLLFYMQNQMGMNYPMNMGKLYYFIYPQLIDPSQMQQFGNPMDPNNVNLNTSSTNGAMFGDMSQQQPNFNMNGVYNMYPGQSGNLNN